MKEMKKMIFEKLPKTEERSKKTYSIIKIVPHKGTKKYIEK